MAAWRYGDQFGKRRTRQMLITSAVLGSAAVIVSGVIYVGASVGSLAGFWGNGSFRDTLVNGRPGARVTARLMPTVNRFGGSATQVRAAVSMLEEIGDASRLLQTLQLRHGAPESAERWQRVGRCAGRRNEASGGRVAPTTIGLIPSARTASRTYRARRGKVRIAAAPPRHATANSAAIATVSVVISLLQNSPQHSSMRGIVASPVVRSVSVVASAEGRPARSGA